MRERERERDVLDRHGRSRTAGTCDQTRPSSLSLSRRGKEDFSGNFSGKVELSVLLVLLMGAGKNSRQIMIVHKQTESAWKDALV